MKEVVLKGYIKDEKVTLKSQIESMEKVDKSVIRGGEGNPIDLFKREKWNKLIK